MNEIIKLKVDNKDISYIDVKNQENYSGFSIDLKDGSHLLTKSALNLLNMLIHEKEELLTEEPRYIESYDVLNGFLTEVNLRFENPKNIEMSLNLSILPPLVDMSLSKEETAQEAVKHIIEDLVPSTDKLLHISSVYISLNRETYDVSVDFGFYNSEIEEYLMPYLLTIQSFLAGVIVNL